MTNAESAEYQRNRKKERRKIRDSRPPNFKDSIKRFIKTIRDGDNLVTIRQIGDILDIYELAFLTTTTKNDNMSMSEQLNYMLERLETEEIKNK